MKRYIDAEQLKAKVKFAKANFYKSVDSDPNDEASLRCGMYCDALLKQIESLE